MKKLFTKTKRSKLLIIVCAALCITAFTLPESKKTIYQEEDPWVLLYESSELKLAFMLEQCADSITYMSYRFLNESPMPLTVSGVVEVSDSLNTHNMAFDNIMLEMNAETIFNCENMTPSLKREIEVNLADTTWQYNFMVNVKELKFN